VTELMTPVAGPAVRREADYTCVAGWELARVFHKYRDPSVPLAMVAERIVTSRDKDGNPVGRLDVRDLKKIVNEVRYRTVGIALADGVLTAIGLNLTHLDLLGEVRVFPTSAKGARLMALDEFYARQQFGDPAPGPQERKRRPKELMDLRRAVLEDVAGRHPANARNGAPEAE